MKSTDMRILILLATMAVLSCSSKKSTEQEQSRRPNIIYILADDLGYGDLSCYGQQNFATPNIDKLVETGTAFEHAYCQSPICTPSRASFLTGMYPSTIHACINVSRQYNRPC